MPDAAKEQGASGGAGGSTAADAARDVPKPTSYNIMPFGDSITASSCPPQLLDQELKAKGCTQSSLSREPSAPSREPQP